MKPNCVGDVDEPSTLAADPKLNHEAGRPTLDFCSAAGLSSDCVSPKTNGDATGFVEKVLTSDCCPAEKLSGVGAAMVGNESQGESSSLMGFLKENPTYETTMPDGSRVRKRPRMLRYSVCTTSNQRQEKSYGRRT